MHTALNYLATPRTLSYPLQDKNPNNKGPTSGSEVASVEIFLGHPVGVQHSEKQHACPFKWYGNGLNADAADFHVKTTGWSYSLTRLNNLDNDWRPSFPV